MTARRVRVWLVLGGIALGACGGRATRATPAAAAEVTAAEVTAAEAEPPTAPAPAPPPPPDVRTAPPPACSPDPSRDPRRKPDHVVALVDATEGMTVVDLGSGDGYFLCRLSRAVGPTGRVIATEIVAKLVRQLTARAAREQLANVEAIRAPTDDVGIAPGSADRILLVNVWHHLANRRRYATRIARALAPGGRVVVVDFPRSRRTGTHGIDPGRVLAELAAGGFDAALVPDELTDQYVIVGAVRRR